MDLYYFKFFWFSLDTGNFYYCNVQMLEKHCKLKCSEDTAFAKKRVVAKRNRYKDKFPCEPQIIILSILPCDYFIIVGVRLTLCYIVTGAAVVHAYIPSPLMWLMCRFHQLPEATIQL